jgi:hypothetical protein
LIRGENNWFIGEDSYLNLRLSEHYSRYDHLSYSGRMSDYNIGLPFILSLVPDIIKRYFPLLIGLLTFIIFYFLLDEFNIKEKELSLLLLIISPTFIYLFNNLNNYFFAVFLSLSGFYLINKKSKVYATLGIFSFFIMPLFNFTISLLSIILLVLYTIFSKKKHKQPYLIALSLTTLIFIIYFAYLTLHSGYQFNYNFSLYEQNFNSKLMQIFSDLGSTFGLSIFAFILFFFGLIKVWKIKYKNLFIFFSVLFLTIMIFIKPTSLFLLNFFVAIFAAKGFYYLYNKVWSNETLKYLTILTLVCGLVFSTASFIKQSIDSQPTDSIMNGLEYLSYQRFGTVLTHPERGKFVNYVGMANVMDTSYSFAPDVNERWQDMQEIFHTRDMEKVLEMIKKYNIRYVWVDDYFKDKVWSYDEDGLLFILKYSPYFKLIYDQDKVKIWKVRNIEKIKEKIK